MKSYFFLLLLIGVTLPGFGQGRDTAFAVHKLFSQKRAGAKGYEAAADSAFSHSRYARLDASRAVTVRKKPDVAGGVAFTGMSLLKGARYSVENEAYVLRLYAAGQPIPPDIRRKLRRKHFHVTARDVVAP